MYSIGLPWLHTWGSGRFSGVARDAQYIVDVICTERVSREQSQRHSGADACAVRS
ncbi:hypothetical protein BURKHO8Y_70060 [Burkholderia sp. 8Y]|nr:hypothetical protein BURKHO8Y_70060 [Burkholderia sp. 8Y]